MPIAPSKLNGVTSLLVDTQQSQIRGGRIPHGAGVGGCAHVGVSSFAHNTGADGAEAIVGVNASMVVCPVYGDGAGGAVSGDASGGVGCFVHEGISRVVIILWGSG